ncbi:hypothetical protein RBB83_17470 [Paenibacillus peoriae]|uniref:hypothetical protein n=1 Tax=Paenibacillus peoriae TaxID=59893 RepID=UPI0030CEBBA0
MRDLNADLAVCEAATRGNWLVADGVYVLDGESWETGGSFVAECEREADAEFTAKAREGWPEAIRRAIATEGLLHGLVDAINRGDLRQVRMSSGTDYAIGSAKRYLSR